MDDLRRSTVERLVEPILQAESVELVELTVNRQGGQVLVRLLIDRPGGINVQHCARVNRALGEVLDAGMIFDERYTVEVSSPGLDRPFASVRDYERAIGEQLEVQLTGEAGSKTVSGMLLSVQDQAIVLTTRSGNVTIPFVHVQRARKALPF
jgi:ribosome maturation factor RimP